jgi:uncharacterized membrane protein YagU involved in acid resistance
MLILTINTILVSAYCLMEHVYRAAHLWRGILALISLCVMVCRFVLC